jgi:Ca2+-binding RTX toxin-like protein
MANIVDDNNGNPLPGTENIDVILGLGGDDIIQGLGGADFLYGGDGNDRVEGGEGNDFMDGGNGENLLDGGNGNDTLVGGAGRDLLESGDGNDFIFGGNDDDLLNAGFGSDYLDGGLGNDILVGFDGNDTLIGGLGIDAFVINGSANGVTTILDFSPNESIELLNLGVVGEEDLFNLRSFSNALGTRTFGSRLLTPQQFTQGTAATTANQRVIYNRNTGAVFVDRDGVGGANQQQVLSLTPFLNLTSANFTADPFAP